jgi:D-alanine-D-alanine ligase
MREPRFDYFPSVLVLYCGGDAGDLQDTLNWVGCLKRTINDLGGEITVFEVTSQNWRRAVRLPGDVVFNLVEDDEYQLYMKVAKGLEDLGKCQVGIGNKGFQFITKKATIKRKLARLGIPTPSFRILNRRSNVEAIKKMEFPLIVKPSGQHAAVGITQDSVVIDKKELEERVQYLFKHHPGEVLAEEYVDGREMHVTVVGNGKHIAVLPIAEIAFRGEYADNWNVYTYDAKWEKSSWEYWDARVVCPTLISDKLKNRIEKLALKAFTEFGCCDVARFDIRIDDKDRPYLIDVNMSPSLNGDDEEDASVRSAKVLGWSYNQFLERVVKMAYIRKYGVIPMRMMRTPLLLQAPSL